MTEEESRAAIVSAVRQATQQLQSTGQNGQNFGWSSRGGEADVLDALVELATELNIQWWARDLIAADAIRVVPAKASELAATLRAPEATCTCDHRKPPKHTSRGCEAEDDESGRLCRCVTTTGIAPNGGRNWVTPTAHDDDEWFD